MVRWMLAAGLAVLASWSTAPFACAQEPPRAAAREQWRTEGLAETIAYVAATKATAFLIIQDGRVIAEHRWPLPADAETFKANFVHGTSARGDLLEDVASTQKSFIAILAGVAIDRGTLDPSKPVTAYLGAGWSKAPPEQEGAILVRHLLEMNSGLNEQFGYVAPPGTRFLYNTPVYASLKPVLEKATGKTLESLTQEWLTGPLGMSDTAWRKRPGSVARTSGNPTGLVTTAQDISRMGQMVLDRGRAPDGKQVISEDELDRMLARTSTNPGYGRLWWLNGGEYSFGAGQAARRTEGQMIPTAPPDLVAAQGAQDRKLYVVPARKLIVVRMGPETGDLAFNEQLWKRLAKAMPAQ